MEAYAPVGSLSRWGGEGGGVPRLIFVQITPQNVLISLDSVLKKHKSLATTTYWEGVGGTQTLGCFEKKKNFNRESGVVFILKKGT